MLLPIMAIIVLNLPVYTCAMDTEPDTNETETLTYAQSNNNKKRFIRDMFTEEQTWDFTLAQKEPMLAYRNATHNHLIPAQTVPSSPIVECILDYAVEKKFNFSVPVAVYEGEKGNYIRCEDTSIHLLMKTKAQSLEHVYVPPCNINRITSITQISQNWLAIASDNTITFCNIYDVHNKMRITFNQLFTFTSITEELGTLVCQTKSEDQFIIYPYHTEIYNLLHGKDLSDSQLEVMFQAAYALYKKQSITFTTEEFAIYSKLPQSIVNLFGYFFPH